MREKQYYQFRKHCQYFSLYWSVSSVVKMSPRASLSRGLTTGTAESKKMDPAPPRDNTMPRDDKGIFYIIASKKAVHPNAVKRNFVKRRLRAAVGNFLKGEVLPRATIKIVAKRELLICSFNELNLALQQNLKALLQ